MASERVLITFEVDASGAIRQVDNVKKSVKEVPAAANQAAAGFAKFTAALAAIGGVAIAFRTAMRGIQGSLQFLGSASEAAAEQQKIFALLESSVDRLGGSYKRLKPILDQHFMDIQRNTEFGDTESAKATQQLIDTTGNLRTAYELLEPTMDLAVSKDMELSNAVKLVGMVYNGQLGTLSRYGISLTDVQRETLKTGTEAEKTAALVGLLDKAFGGAARTAGAQTIGAWAGIQNALGDVMESIGDLIVQSDLLPAAFNTVENILLGAATAMSDLGEKFRDLEELIKTLDFTDVAEALEDVVEALGAFGTEINWNNVKAGVLILVEMAKREVVDNLKLFAAAIETIAGTLERLKDGFNFTSALTGGIQDSLTDIPPKIDMVASHVRGSMPQIGDAFDQAGKSVKDLGLQFALLDSLSDQATSALGMAYDRIIKEDEKLKRIRGLLEMEQATKKTADSLDIVTDRVKELAKESEESTNKTRNHFDDLADDIRGTMGDVLTVAILGDWDNFFDLLDQKWKETFEGLLGDLTEQFSEAFSGDGDGSIMSAFSEFWDGLKADIDADPIGSMISGVGGMYAASQGSGGTSGAIQGAMGGAMAGLGIGAAIYGGLAAMGPAGWIIAGVLALVGGVTGFMGGGGIEPYSAGGMSLQTGYGMVTNARDQHLDDATSRAWIEDRAEEWNAAFDSMYSVVQIFSDLDLFELLGDPSAWSFDGKGDLNAWAQLFREQVIPDALREVFELAIETGLGNLGVSDAKIEALWAELGVMGTDRMIESLSTFVAAVVGMADLLDEMEWQSIADDAGMSSMDRVREMFTDAFEAIEMMTAGIDGMDPIQQAETALEVQQMVNQVRQAEVQMLQQINALQEQINLSIDQQIESINLGGMEPGQQSQYFLDQIVSLMDQLNSGTIGSPEELQQVMAQLMGYIAQYQSVMGENLYVAGDDGIVPSEWLIEVLEQARTLSTQQLDTFRQEMIDQNQAILDVLYLINDSLTMTQAELVVDGDIDVTITLDPDLLNARIDRRIRYRLENGHWLG